MATTIARPTGGRLRKNLSYFKRYWTLYLLLLLPMAFFVIFRYIPMTYIQVAFKKYWLGISPWQMEWAKNNGFEFFIQAFKNQDFINAIRNTITLNLLDLVFGFPAPIILAILLNELTFKRYKKVTQTILYMPHFLSWVIIAGLARQVLGPSGLVNQVINAMGMGSIQFLDNPGTWVGSYVFIGIWQSVGWNAIIYMAAITAISPELYEAASVDGAGRLRKIWHITLPGLRPTIVTLLIMNLGRILGSEFDRPYALRNPLVRSVSYVLSIFVYQWGIESLKFSLAAAVGLFQSVICVIFLIIANTVAKRFGERGIW